MKIILFTGVFLLTLQDFYSYTYNLAILPVVGALLIILIFLIKSDKLLLSYKHIILLNIFYIVPLALGLLNYLFNYELISLKRLFGLLLCVFIFFIFSSLFKRYPIEIKKSLYFVLIVHTIFFYINLLDIYFFGHLIDPIFLFTNVEEQAPHFTYIYGKQILRPCGLFQEPGTYAAYMSPLILYFATSKFKISKLIIGLSIASLFVSLSTFGFILGFIILLFQNLLNNRTLKFFFTISLLSIGILFSILRFYPSTSNNYLNLSHENRITKENTGFERRIYLINKLVDTYSQNSSIFLFGHNILNPFGISKLGSVIASNDGGYLVYSILFNGVIYTTFFYFIYFIVFIKRSNRLAFILLLTLSKISIFSLVFPLYLFLFHDN